MSIEQPTREPFSDLSGSPIPLANKPTSFGKAGLVVFLTLISRFFGLARDAAIAYVVGTKAGADAFYVAFRIPNLLRRLFAEGNLTLSFVPVFTQSLKESKEEAKTVADVTFTAILMLLIVVSLVGIIGAGLFVRLTAYGFTKEPEKFALTVFLTRITFPYILLVSLGALSMGILNARKHFAAPAFSPVLLNVGMIIGALWWSKFFEMRSVGIAWGVLLGGVLQLAVQIPFLIKQGFLPRLRFDFKSPALKKIARLMLPSVYGSAVYQINLLAITFMASFLPTGAVSYLWYADRVIEFPLGVIAISLATVALPVLSEHAANHDTLRMKEDFRKALAMAWFLNIPAAIGLMVLAKPVIAVLFYRGGFTQMSTILTAQTLQFFALGLPFVSATRITSTAFFAVQESKKPVRAANIAVLVNILAGFILIWPLQFRGLALGVALGSMTNFMIQMVDYRKQVGPLGLKKMAQSFVKMFFAALMMALVLVVIQHYWNWTFARFVYRLGFLIALILIGMGIYFSLIVLFKVEEGGLFLKKVRRKLF